MNENIVGCIICEETNTNVEFKVKEVNRNGFIIAEGILQEGDEVNRNKRCYPVSELAAAINSPRTKELVESGNLKGEAGHPTDTSLARQAKVDPTLEQVWYTKLWMDGKYVMGHFRGTNNELGKSFNEDLRDGQRPSFSLRAVGSLVNEAGKMTVRKMQMITYDRVYFPSHSKAYTQKIVTTESFGKPIYVPSYEIESDNYFSAKVSEINKLCENGNIVNINEDTIITPLKQDEISSFLLSESAQLRQALDSFSCLYETMELQPNFRVAKVKNTFGDTLYLDVDRAIQKELINAVSSYY